MNEKRIHIIETAVQLFAQKGYHLTSIQEIAEAAGIAKGSMYLYFKSKEDLLLSIYKYYFDLLFQQSDQIAQDRSLSPKERLRQQLIKQIEYIMQHRSFIKMQMREQPIPLNDEIERFMFKVRAMTFQWSHHNFLDIYGQEIEPYSLDAAVIMSGMVKEYMTYIILDNKPLDIDKLVTFLIERMDDVAAGFAKAKQEPILNNMIMADFLLSDQRMEVGDLKKQLQALLVQFRSQAKQNINLPKQEKECLDALTVIEEELRKTEPRAVVIQGMLSYLDGLRISQTEHLLREMEYIVEQIEKAGV